MALNTKYGDPGHGRIGAGEWWLRGLAPYAAVGVGLYLLGSAWVAILLYHAQILLWNRREYGRLLRGWPVWSGWTVAACALGGPLAWFLLPWMERAPGALAAWLLAQGLTGGAFLLLVPYFGLLHPALEQVHWSRLRQRDGFGAVAHGLFAGYHVLVVAPFLALPWVAVCAVILLAASALWQRLTKRAAGGLRAAWLSHAAADLGIAAAAWAYVAR